jgi:hypothetical protein
MQTAQTTSEQRALDRAARPARKGFTAARVKRDPQWRKARRAARQLQEITL